VRGETKNINTKTLRHEDTKTQRKLKKQKKNKAKPVTSASAASDAYLFVPLDEDGLQTYSGWFAANELRQWVEPPTRQWFEYVCNTPGCHAWLVRDTDGSAVAEVQLDEQPDGHASLLLFVKPEARNQRHGRAILRALIAWPEIAHLHTIEAGIEAGNSASLRCCLAAGFRVANPTPDAEGFLKLVYNR
jgi:RimJ/RimL family protein N-acetyltransferase